MDFIDWCDRVLRAMANVMAASPQARSMGTRDLEIAAALFGQDAGYGASDFHGSNRHQAVNDALLELHRVGLADRPSQGWWRVGQLGERVLADPAPFWSELAQLVEGDLTPERRQLLDVVNRLSPRLAGDYAWLEWVGGGDLLSDLSWSGDLALLQAVARELDERGLVARYPTMGALRLCSTYRGLVWSTRRHLARRPEAAAWPPITPRQERLLFSLVDWSRADPDGRDLQYLELDQTSYFAGHAGHVERSDIDQLALKGYIHTHQPVPRGITFVSVTAEGHAYYEARHREHQPAEHLATRVREYVDTTAIAAYPEAAQRLQEAAEALWSARHDADVTEVGFKCREALQSFAVAYYARFYPRAAHEPIPKEKTGDLVSKVIRHLQQARGETDTSFADALYGFWRRLIDLDQKVVHDSTTPDRPLNWEHARRVLLYSYLVIGELHLLATDGHT